ncbi:MAG: ribosomal protein S18-alanine N-acetyltransferase [candidate division Zixibacteria bacterium]|nr:ribosomal protein S18-alanine N-acetyltransferase [candidate division Zixibacteria bacterium]
MFLNPWPDYSFEMDLTSDHTRLWTLLADNEIAGYAVAYIIEDEFQIANFAIAKEFQKKGLGTELIKFILQEAEKAGCGYCYLEVRTGNKPAISLYKKFGFKIVNIMINYYQNPPEDAFIMIMKI